MHMDEEFILLLFIFLFIIYLFELWCYVTVNTILVNTILEALLPNLLDKIDTEILLNATTFDSEAPGTTFISLSQDERNQIVHLWIPFDWNQ